MESYEEPAPEGLWESISSDYIIRPRVAWWRDRRLWYGFAGSVAAAVVILMLSGPWWLGRMQDGFAVTGHERYTLAMSGSPSVHVGPVMKCVPLYDFQERVHNTEVDDMAVLPEAETVENSASIEENGENGPWEDVSVAEAVNESPYVEDIRHGAESFDDWDREKEPRKGTGHRWAAGLMASNVPSSVSSSSAGFNATMFPAMSGVTVGALSDIRSFNTTRETNTSSTHFQPLRVGVSVRYMITNRWSVESGVTYAYLRSKVRSGSDEYYYSAQQSLHYIGLPLNLNFNVWGNRYLTVYASAGGLMEKCVGGELRTVSYFNGAKGDTVLEDIMVKPLQWSVSASLGLQYNLSWLLGFYLEPGVMYSFDNGSPIRTVYNARPIDFNLKLGLRFMF